MSEQQTDGTVTKRFMVVNRKAPHGTVYALEVPGDGADLRHVDQDVHVAFLDNGVWQLRRGQAPAVLEMKDFSKTYRAWKATA